MKNINLPLHPLLNSKAFITISIFMAFLFISLNAYSLKIHPLAGSTSATFLKIPVGARPSSMAAGFTSISNDIYSFFYNPSAISDIKNKNITFMHNNYFASFNQVFFGYGFEPKFINNKDYFFVSLNYFYSNNLEKRTGFYETDPFNPSPIEGKFDSKDYSLNLNYAFVYTTNTFLGFGVKYINQKIDSYSGSSLAIDLGLMKEFLIKQRKIDFGFSILNIGRGIRLIEKRYDLPLTFRAGVSSYLYNTLFSFDITKYIDNYPYFSLGIDKKINENISIRLGYRYRMYGNELGFFSGFASGIGIKYNRFLFDYSLNPYGDLGYSHKISLTINYWDGRYLKHI